MSAGYNALDVMAITDPSDAAIPVQVSAYAERLQDLLLGQQATMTLACSGLCLADVLSSLVGLVETAFPSAVVLVTLAQCNSGTVKYQTSRGLPSELLSIDRLKTNDCPPGPTAACLLGRERVIVSDLSTDRRWSAHAAVALAHGFTSCWVEPISDCGDSLSGAIALYWPNRREPSSGDDYILRALAAFGCFVVNAVKREKALRATNERFAALVSAIPGVVYQRVVKPDGDIRYTYISEQARELFGVSPQKIIADPEALFKTHGPEYRARFRERLLAASRELIMWDVEATLVMPDGSKKYTHAIARPARQVDGSVVWTGLILDETRTREAILDGLSQGFILYDAQDRMIMRNNHYLT